MEILVEDLCDICKGSGVKLGILKEICKYCLGFG